MKWEPRNNYPDLVKAQFIDIPPRVKAGYEAEEVWFFGEQNNHAPAPVSSLGPPSTGILKMPKAPNCVMHSGCVETDEGPPAAPFEMQAKEEKDDSNSAEKHLQFEEEAIVNKNTSQTYGSGIKIDERGRVRRISIRRRGRCEVQQSAAVDKIAQIFGSGLRLISVEGSAGESLTE